MEKSTLTIQSVNNDIYNLLGKRWYTAEDDPVALLRAESKFLNPWILNSIQSHFGEKRLDILDAGCGGGFLSNFLAQNGHQVTGIDQSRESLEVAKHYDMTKKVDYVCSDVYSLPFESQRYDVVCAMDFLEHLENPKLAISEMGRVLKPGGLFFFHTFNRNWLSYFVIIKFVEWFIKNTPPNLHILRLFIKPKELASYCDQAGLEVVQMKGLDPVLFSLPFFETVRTGLVHPNFRFKMGKSLLTSYFGYSLKRAK